MAKYSYDDLTYEYLHKVLSYDSETGEFYHKPRPRDMFKTDGSWKSWNTRFANEKAGSPANIRPKSKTGYWLIHIGVLGKCRKAHRIAWFMHYGEWPKDQIDHINGDATDNRIENLRDVSNIENNQNRSLSSSNKSGTTGVYWYSRRRRWLAQITIGYKSVYIGLFKHKEDAIAARKAAEIKYGFHENHGREQANAKGE